MTGNAAADHRTPGSPSGNLFRPPPRSRATSSSARPAPPAPARLVDEPPPGRLALPAHALDCEKNLLAVLPYAQRDQQRNRRRLSVEPHARHRPVEDQPGDRLIGERTAIPSVPIALCLAPNPADRVLPDGAAE